MHATLSSLDEDARHIVAIGDAAANLLWVTGDPETCERAREMRFQEGACWSEHDAGTNAVGTAAALDHSVQIFSAEHLVSAVHSWTCSAAPIHEPATGELIGVVDLTADYRTNHSHTLSLAALVASVAEAALNGHSLELAQRLRERWETAIGGRRTPSALLDTHGRVIASRGAGELPSRLELATTREGAIALPDGRVGELQALVGGAILWLGRRARPGRARLRLRLLGHDASAQLGTGRRERGLRSLEMLALLAMHPEGMTAEELALELYGERGKAVTIRAQVHRVRKELGESVATHPYRLDAPPDADWLEARRLVSAGRPREALRAYSGPCCRLRTSPGSSRSGCCLRNRCGARFSPRPIPNCSHAGWRTPPAPMTWQPRARSSPCSPVVIRDERLRRQRRGRSRIAAPRSGAENLSLEINLTGPAHLPHATRVQPPRGYRSVAEPGEEERDGNAYTGGLAAGIWTNNLSKAHRLIPQLRAGSVWVNAYNIFDAALPFGGYKQSGWGREMGEEVIYEYTETKSVCIGL